MSPENPSEGHQATWGSSAQPGCKLVCHSPTGDPPGTRELQQVLVRAAARGALPGVDPGWGLGTSSARCDWVGTRAPALEHGTPHQNSRQNSRRFASLVDRVWDKQLPVVTWGGLACNGRAALLASRHLEPTAWAVPADLVGSRVVAPIH
jgi:hypothetical protein